MIRLNLWSRLASILPPYEIIAIFAVVAFSVLIRSGLMNMRPFQSDESIYLYTGYAMTRGVTPYREVFLAHPPLMFLLFSAFVQLVGTNLTLILVLNYMIFGLTVFLTYLMCKIVVGNEGGVHLGLLAASLYAFYPMVVALSITASAEIILTVFTLSSVIVYAKYFDYPSPKPMFLVGLLLGLALITKLTAVVFVLVLILYHFTRNSLAARFRKALVDTIAICFGVAVPVGTVLVLIMYWQSFPQFIMQTYYLQTIRSPLTVAERLDIWVVYAGTFSFLLVTGAGGAFYHISKARQQKNQLILLLTWIYGLNSLTLIVFPISLLHYFLYLTPYLVLLSALGLQKMTGMLLKRSVLRGQPRSLQRKIVALSAVILVALILFQSASNVAPYVDYLLKNPYTEAEENVSAYVVRVTGSNDKIWTSEPAIAFLAQRLIIAPNSTNWPLHGFFDDVFNTEYRGHEGLGIVSPDQFIQAWDKEGTKAIIIIRGEGWVPYPDRILWAGFENQKGVVDYVESNYVMVANMTFSEIPYAYEIWLRS